MNSHASIWAAARGTLLAGSLTAVVWSALVFALLMIALLVPIVHLFVPPFAIATAAAFIYSVSWTAYLLCGCESHGHIFLPLAPYRCILVCRAVYEYLKASVSLIQYAITAIRSHPPETSNIKYAMPFHRRTLDVYPAANGAPVIVLVPSFMHPIYITGSKRAYVPLAQKLNQNGYCVVVPDIRYSTDQRLRRAIIDLRLVLSWVGAHIEGYGGASNRIYTLGHGLSAHLALITVVQEAAVLSQGLNGYDLSSSRPPSAVLGDTSVDINALEIYAAQIRLPQLRGLVLISGVYDVIKAYHNETTRGVERLSLLRRMAGPSLTKCLQHSPAHILASAYKILDHHFLPSRVLIMHGGNDHVSSIDHATLLHTQLEEAGVETVELCAVRSAGHLDLLTSVHDSAALSDFIV
ncbi:hypothetical protein MCUN1_000713 [Malassezia cuniculi]|uniref:BD-FAE-like domain-containing protein n=1 Tax=Malassezia cuniculi TaxID=948313 RepID=A0AAF0EST9_9BASI|nr:hypothetical protein MCUN1_000713 [Malassezia cuniculi]